MVNLSLWSPHSRWTITLIGIAISTTLLFSAITSSPYLYDDVMNKDIRIISANEGLTLFDQVLRYTTGWMGAEGRFFPGSLGWSFSIFWIFNSLMSYKLVVASVVALSIAAFSWLIGLLLRNTHAILVTWLGLLFLNQIRYWFDGLTSFAALVPLTILLVSLSTIAAISSSKWWAISFSGVLFLIPLLTYEVVILFSPLIIGAIYLRNKSWKRTLGVAIPTILVALFSLFLRVNLGRQSPSSAYTISLDLVKFWETFIEQFLAALPFSQWILAGELPATHLVKFLLIVGILALIPVALAIFFLLQAEHNVSRGATIALAFSGLWIWISSAGIVALSGRWQSELALGQGYLSVIYEYFGLSLILTALALTFSRLINKSHMRTSSKLWLLLSASGFSSFLICLALSANFLVVST